MLYNCFPGAESVSENGWCPMKTKELNYTIKSYHILNWEKRETMGRALLECKWRIHINRSYRIRFDVQNIQLYSFTCYQNYMAGLTYCSDNITIYYDDCEPGKEIVSYPRTKAGPSSFIGNTDALCFHFIPSRQNNFNGMFFSRKFYLKIGVAVLASYCGYIDRNEPGCAEICYANGTRVSPCLGKVISLN